jgi:hypothetical protein
VTADSRSALPKLAGWLTQTGSEKVLATPATPSPRRHWMTQLCRLPR